ncbi:hypothetical protein TcWFU_007735 [Taenia crassiceps]|uniref:Uncharacterized protein n=1 Tax=Taenia crassiceps TaxID=6207 RepID=A0ABR4Q4H3_9CEST
MSQATSDALVLAGRSWSGVVTVTASAWLRMRLESLQVLSILVTDVIFLSICNRGAFELVTDFILQILVNMIGGDVFGFSLA